MGFGVNNKPLSAGRSSGSIAWTGINNTFFWIDPSRNSRRADDADRNSLQMTTADAVVEQLERAVYANLPKTLAGGTQQVLPVIGPPIPTVGLATILLDSLGESALIS